LQGYAREVAYWSHWGSVGNKSCNRSLSKYLFCEDINLSVCAKQLSNVRDEMLIMNEGTNVHISDETHYRLSEVGKKGDTFNHIIERLLDAYEAKQ